MPVTTKLSRDVTVMNVTGALKAGSPDFEAFAREIDAFIKNLEEGRSTKLLMDVTEVTQADGSGLGKLFYAMAAAPSRHGTVKVVALPQQRTTWGMPRLTEVEDLTHEEAALFRETASQLR